MHLMVNYVFAVVKLHILSEANKHHAQIYHSFARTYNNLFIRKS